MTRPAYVSLQDYVRWGDYYWACRTCVTANGWAGTLAEAHDLARGHVRICPTVLAGLDRLVAAVMDAPDIGPSVDGIAWCRSCDADVTDESEQLHDCRAVEQERADRFIAHMGYDRPLAERAARAKALADSGVVPVRLWPSRSATWCSSCEVDVTDEQHHVEHHLTVRAPEPAADPFGDDVRAAVAEGRPLAAVLARHGIDEDTASARLGDYRGRLSLMPVYGPGQYDTGAA